MSDPTDGNLLLFRRVNFPGINRFESTCGVAIHATPTKPPIVVIIEVVDNPGTSVTNAVDTLPERLRDEFLPYVELTEIQFFEAFEERLRAHGGRDPMLARVERGPQGWGWRVATSEERADVDPLTAEWAASNGT